MNAKGNGDIRQFLNHTGQDPQDNRKRVGEDGRERVFNPTTSSKYQKFNLQHTSIPCKNIKSIALVSSAKHPPQCH